MLSLLLTRHAQSEWNLLGRWQGQQDPPLSAGGRAQAQAAARKSGSFDAVLSSTLLRALQTAEIISEANGIGPVLSDPRWMERNAGGYEGLTRSEIEDRFPGCLANGTRPPGWEPDASIVARVLDVMGEVAERSGGSGDVLVVTHSGVIYAVEDRLGAAFERIGNMSGRWVHHDGSLWRLGERVVLAPEDTFRQDTFPPSVGLQDRGA